MTDPVKIREMKLSDMDSLMRIKNAEGWNQTEKDWELLIHYPESVNLVAVHDNRILGTVTAINYAHRVAWIGMMLVDKDFRGRGISKLLLVKPFANWLCVNPSNWMQHPQEGRYI